MQLTRRGAAPLAALSALSALALAGCSHPAAPGGAGVEPTVAGTPAGTVATITTPKGGTLALSQAAFSAQLQAYVPASQQNQQLLRLPAGQVVMQQMLQGLLFEGLAQDQGVAPTDAEVDTQYANLKTVQEIRNVKPFDQVLASLGLTPDLVKETQIKPQLALTKLLTKGVTIPDADIQKYYDANKDKPITPATPDAQAGFTLPARAHIRKIAVATPGEAQAIIAAIKGGQSFDSQVGQSLDKSTPDGDFPVWIATDPPAPGFDVLIKPLNATAEGALTPPIPVPGQAGTTYWVVQVVKKEKKQTLPFDQAKELIRAILIQQKATATGQQSLAAPLHDFQAAAKVNIAGPQYATLAQQITHPAPIPAPSAAPGGGGSPFAPR